MCGAVWDQQEPNRTRQTDRITNTIMITQFTFCISLIIRWIAKPLIRSTSSWCTLCIQIPESHPRRAVIALSKMLLHYNHKCEPAYARVRPTFQAKGHAFQVLSLAVNIRQAKVFGNGVHSKASVRWSLVYRRGLPSTDHHWLEVTALWVEAFSYFCLDWQQHPVHDIRCKLC